MDTNLEQPRPLISEALAHIKAELLCGRMAASDAALSASRISRIFFTDNHLLPLRRELLGYTQEQMEAELEVIALISKYGADINVRTLARHRLLRGFRMPLFLAMRRARDKVRPQVKREEWFCPLSAVEIENLLLKLESTDASYVVLESTGDYDGAFVCKTAELRQLYKGMSELIAFFIDVLLRQLQQLPSEFCADQLDQTTARAKRQR
jgi:hypothetical protein